MRLLSFDTSTAVISVALGDDKGLTVERLLVPEDGQRQQSVSMLMPSIDAAMQEAGWRPSSLDAIVVGTGPGSFTGVRVSVVTARGLAQGLALPLVGISRLDCLARTMELPAAIVLRGGRDHFYVGTFQKGKDGSIENLFEASCLTGSELPDLMRKMPRGARLCTDTCELDDLCGGELSELAIIDISSSQSRIASLQACMARELIGSGKIKSADFPYEEVKPLYLRGASITLKKKKHGRR